MGKDVGTTNSVCLASGIRWPQLLGEFQYLVGFSIAYRGLGVGLSFWTSAHAVYCELFFIDFLEVCVASGGGGNTCGFVDFTLGW